MGITKRSTGLAVAFLLAAAPLAAQVTGTGTARGWIGVSFELRSTEAEGHVQTVVTVTDVIEGGPAFKAGVRPGDVVLSVNDRSFQEELGVERGGLRAGERVRLVVSRDGRRRTLEVTAVPRPADVVPAPATWAWTLRADSIAEVMYKAMDSLRLRLIQRDAKTGITVITPFGSAPTVVAEGPGVAEVRPPFPFLVFQGQGFDSLRGEMDQLNQSIRELRARQAVRTRDLARRSTDGRVDRNDPELLRLEEALKETDRQASELRVALERASSRGVAEHMGTVWVTPEAPVVALDRETVEGALARVRPLAPYVLGQNRVAGAEIVDLQPALATYFQVEGGVLVVDVPDGTPAARSGLQPGDVLIAADGRKVRSILDLREGLARADAQLPVTLVRKGKEMQLLLRR